MASKKPGNEGGIKNLFAQHVEKMALGVAALMVIVFLYMGMKNKPLSSDREAVALERAVDSAKRKVHETTWDQIWRHKEWPEPDFHKKAALDAVNVDPKAYQISWLDPPKFHTLQPRVDPRLMPVEKLEVRPGVIAALANRGGRDDDGGAAGRPRGGDELLDDDDESGPPTLRREQIDALDRGFRDADRNSRVVAKYFVAVRGIVPIVNQQAEYDRCFSRAMKDENHATYAADRDIPKYIYAYIERQEVDAKGNPVPVTGRDGEETLWVRMGMSKKISDVAAESWPGVEEPADERYVDENLTMPPPPLLMQDYVSLVMHPDVPFKRKKSDEKKTDGGRKEDPGPGVLEPGGPGPEPVGGPEDIDDNEDPRKESSTKSTEKPAAYRLLRYYDFNVDPAKRYRYRVQLLLEDPNNPKDEKTAPEPATLDAAVIKRIEDQQKNATRRIYWRETEWSEDSAIVGFPPTRRVLAGGVTPANYIDAGEGARILRKGPMATVMALVWDEREAVWVPGVADELNLGSIVDFAKNVWVMDPLTLNPRRLSAYPFDTGYTVADVYGGEILPSSDRKVKLTVPGEVLLIGEDGGVNVRTEFGDADTYSLFNYTSGDGDAAAPARRPTRSGGDRRATSPHGQGGSDDDLFGEE